ncbi:transducin beta-like protein 3 [Papaver somniferum]|uniref:transducin beta-like protein 3 n=1 Tax=Papaver somniferum TaxID=3469 RepID=UPI000E700A38|nr:transducin beta-like protein 3 [Papaver somniferum]
MATTSYKKNYRCVPSLEQFYSQGSAVAVSSDGSFLACGCDDKIKIVDSSNSSIIKTLEGDSERVTALTLSPNDKFLFSASSSRLITVWDLSTSKPLRQWKGHEGSVRGMTCDASGGILATAGEDRLVRVWDVDGGFCTHNFKGHEQVVTSVLFHPNPHQLLLFSGSDDGKVRVWDLVGRKCTYVLDKHFSTVTSLAVAEDGYTLLSGGRDKVVNLWNLREGTLKKTVPTYEMVETVCVIHSGTHFYSSLGLNETSTAKKKESSPPVIFLTVGERGVVRIWNSEGAICLFEQGSSDVAISSNKDELKRGFVAAVLMPSDQGLLCLTADQQFLFYSLEQSVEEAFCLKLSRRLVGYNEEIVDMKFLGDDEQFLAVATNIEQVRMYDLASMSCSYVLTGHSEIVLCLDTCISSSGKTLVVTGSKDNSVRLWENSSCIGIGTGHMGAVGAVAFSKKKNNFIVSGSSDRTLKVWSFDGLQDNGSEIMNLRAKAVVAAHDKDINSLAVAPNDNLVCSGSQDRTACVWRLPDLVSVVVLKGHKRGIWCVEFSPVDQCVITASGDKTIKIWAISDGACLKTFEGHTSSILRVSFLTRGTQFVSSGADGLVKLWTVKTNECIATYDQHEDKVWALAVGKKTEMLATGGGDAVVNLWHDSTVEDKEEAFRKEEEGVLKGQELENALSDANYIKAIKIAFELRRPHKLFDLFSELFRKKHAEDQVDKALQSLGIDEQYQLFEYVREWNSKPKLCSVAQFVLSRVFSTLPPKEIIEIKGISEILEGLIPYTQRHFSRADRLERSTLLLDYTLHGMSVIEPLETNDSQRLPNGESALQHSDEKTKEMLGEVLNSEQSDAPTEAKQLSSKKRKSRKSKESGKVKSRKAVE